MTEFLDLLMNPVAFEGVDTSYGFLGSLIGIGASLFGANKQKKAAKAEAEATAEAARLNAEQTKERAKVETTLRERAGQREAGTISTAAGASGVTKGGSAADILRESARNTQFDLGTIKTQSELQVKVFEQEGKGALKAGKARGQAALASGIGSAASILLGG